jgi:hypothetical protein
VGPDPDQRREHRWTETEGEDVIQRRFHGADDDWLEKAAVGLPMGKLGQVDEIADFVVFLLSARSGVVTGSVLDWDQVVPAPTNSPRSGRSTDAMRIGLIGVGRIGALHAHKRSRTFQRSTSSSSPDASPDLAQRVAERLT